jgi:hypothetical protein
MTEEFERVVAPDGLNELDLPAVRYEWRTKDGRCTIARNIGENTYWAKVDGQFVGKAYGPIRDPMIAKKEISGLTRAKQAALGAAQRKGTP